ncbi:MAG: MFS transporter, partial [Candidatus Thiodiazotropha sp.]
MDSIDSKMDVKTPWFIYILSFFSAIGGFLFGYDTGVVSGAMLLLKNYFHLSSLLEEVIVSVTIGFACIFALCGGLLNDKFGRKFTTILASLVFTIGAVILAAAVNVEMLIVGRAILGMG